MSLKSNFREQLEAYFSGEMKGADRLVFEGRVESDPAMKADFDNQSDVIETLKAHRKSELKVRLNSISVEPTLIGSLLQSAALKPMIYAVSGIVFVSGSYFFYNTEATTDYHIQKLNGKKEYSMANSIDVNEKLVLDYRYEHTPIIEGNELAQIPVVELEQSTLVEESPNVISDEIAFEVPEIGDGMTVDEFKAPVLALDEAKRIEEVPSVSTLDKVNVNTINSRKYNFHYRIEDNRLFLYGKFNESPYEIIEINSPSNKDLFFYYNGSFYNLNKDANAITPLSKIEDSKLEQQLDLLKNKSKNQ